MILPISAFGTTVLRKMAEPVTLDKSYLQPILDNMYETMYAANGVGLAAPQVGLAERIFIIDSSVIDTDDKRKENAKDAHKSAFINAQMIEETGELVSMEEGCLSIPGIYGQVERRSTITIEYYDDALIKQKRTFGGFTARVIQHEYDHIEGILFVDKLKPIRKQMIKRKLDDIKKGIVNARYKMKFS